MSWDVASLVATIRSILEGIRSKQITFLAASLAYYAFVSLIPLLLLAIAIGTTLGGATFSNTVSEPVTTAIGGEAGSIVRDALERRSGSSGATVVGLLVLLWSGLKLFRGIDIAFSTVYSGVSSPGFTEQFRNALLTLFGVGIGIMLTVAIGTILAVSDVAAVVDDYLVVTIGTVIQVGGLILSLLPIYYILPGVTVSVREVVPGAVFTAIGWTVLQTAFRTYTEYATSYAAYGVLGGGLLLVTFLYFGGLILLVGVVINATLAGRLDTATDETDDGDDHGGTKTEPTT
ncbi:YihY/virulence factor BrkB family protein [Halocatena salina]|uniref:YihY/virulence factor BrkB family protein n=1 Tax=Halocatena salina TaxID=2934340 RepID=A0A8U0A5A3_9EURY|nr:YihY/virulence factor BrkB family protein [Halocatena salina]UPM43648.1 YihY/virulence factor BrkB family protein [Halocatena salina]